MAYVILILSLILIFKKGINKIITGPGEAQEEETLGWTPEDKY